MSLLSLVPTFIAAYGSPSAQAVGPRGQPEDGRKGLYNGRQSLSSEPTPVISTMISKSHFKLLWHGEAALKEMLTPAV